MAVVALAAVALAAVAGATTTGASEAIEATGVGVRTVVSDSEAARAGVATLEAEGVSALARRRLRAT